MSAGSCRDEGDWPRQKYTDRQLAQMASAPGAELRINGSRAVVTTRSRFRSTATGFDRNSDGTWSPACR